MLTYDVVGVGFGPSNLALAVALREQFPDSTVLFVERKEAFSWHPGLMFDGAEMQVSFLKDLVSMRNPTSRFSFLQYLNVRNRLAEFVNLRSFYPSRVEFNDYYSWVADQFADDVMYSTEVVGITPQVDGGGELIAAVLDLRELNGTQVTPIAARNVVIAPGGLPKVPAGVQTGARVFHASETVPRLAEQFSDGSAPYTFNIVGAGQTAADVFMHLSSSFPNSRIQVTIRGFAIRPEDDTHFVNELFDPSMPDWFFDTTPALRHKVLTDFAYAAHSGVSYDLIPQLFRKTYESKVDGTNKYRFERFSELTKAVDVDGVARGTYRNLENGQDRVQDFDGIILATGYEYQNPVPIVAGLRDFLAIDSGGKYIIERDYSLRTTARSRCKVFLQGFGEATHGFSEVLLSLLPFRAAEIALSSNAGSHTAAAIADNLARR